MGSSKPENMSPAVRAMYASAISMVLLIGSVHYMISDPARFLYPSIFGIICGLSGLFFSWRLFRNTTGENTFAESEESE